MKKVINLFNQNGQIDYKTEVLSGITVALALVPEAVAFALIAGLSPLTGLYAAFMMGLVTSILGGRPGMISGATGAVAVVLVALVKTHGVEYIFATVILAGILQVLAGTFRLGKLIRLVPHPVIFGFVNGLAVVIFMAQLTQFQDDAGNWLTGTPLYVFLGLVLLTMAIIWLLPKFTKAIPASLASILVVFGLVALFNLDTKTVGDIASIKGGFPPFHLPNVPFEWETLTVIFPYAAIVAGVGLIESLLTLNIVDEITESHGKSNKEAIAQGTANILSGLFSGMGGCAMIGQSLINISNGARARISGIVASIMLLMFVMFGSSLIEQVPMAALTGLMIMVSIGTFEWASLRVFTKFPKSDILVMVLVTLVTIMLHNLALAVVVGVIIAALVFAWDNAKHIRVLKYVDDKAIRYYEVTGPLFFASTTTFIEKFNVTGDPKEVVIDFKNSRVADMSAIEALNKLTERYKKLGKKVHLRHLSSDCRALIKNAESVIDVNVMEDPTYKVMLDD
ncbi:MULTISPECIES: SulP family inorganic anion transporter [Pasteurellaceae]|uniref:SulP family inorganic anion transporter n=1 Tax=Pasteurella atlantica TaxID=2827233 RepID=A0AAW8CHF5_9PAST|nr:SulP family inorganic anion transporter [Pasteurella atlantica]MBR0574509.1 SulP family inorganic anion transporter [Pasteurella atlantica]MDP8040352.1 SulP family inorganic anion transporter [Pasteurella atlantica]MDP8042403.1 SulP family inorganic anion transporter [Pasteurella atlantica]MDP8044622.1 SulP family inorganic anion transporter [Pasteurella atlantica]MDP8046695.1 SulP family inorganic anion transporter [Pasteurella atlantica]